MDYVRNYGSTPAVVSMSLGGGASNAEDQAVKNLYNAGFVVSVAAGNDNSNACFSSPARAPEVSGVNSVWLQSAPCLPKGFINFTNFKRMHLIPLSDIAGLDIRTRNGLYPLLFVKWFVLYSLNVCLCLAAIRQRALLTGNIR